MSAITNRSKQIHAFKGGHLNDLFAVDPLG